MSRMLHDKTFYRTFAILTLSLALQNLLTYSVNLTDNIMPVSYTHLAMTSDSLPTPEGSIRMRAGW